MKLKPLILALSVIGVIPVASAAQTSDAQTVSVAAQSLKQKLKALESFRAKFEQSVIDQDGHLIQSGKGEIALQYPAKIRWQQDEPDETLLVSDGLRTVYFDSFAEQATILNTLGLIDTTPFVLLTTQDPKQWQKYSVSEISGGYRIEPVQTGAQVERLDVLFADNSLKIGQLNVTDSSGQISSFKFSGAQINVPIDAGQFKFVIPEGVVVDDQTQSD
ncbi:MULTISPECIES: outer membrane lipoprotein chaperone LolA [unclassified Pseudoalteromonas]|uniref:outer membrane lipoprotein chaperone LolA n=1 Tax=unclassified Pseudoalteromonas TaxID=194690 RepID=UPI002096B21D|nr:outer membrane lipoprotein chaperone LolA [Pseudoalteromonas sp. XMcav2-N]MCO7187759.1 outer membrane lipoprotein chaperone LolA [Pseudoalteromonas sp. XMcav2-N]